MNYRKIWFAFIVATIAWGATVRGPLLVKSKVWRVQAWYRADTVSEHMAACMHGASYPDSWRNYSGPGFNVYSRNSWCSEAREEFEQRLEPRLDAIYDLIVGP